MILAVLQAVTTSRRLPRKVLAPILGTPMLMRQIERINRSKEIDQLVLATSVEVADDPIEWLCREHGIGCFRGDRVDVLDRFYQAGKGYDRAHVVRLTGDCPLTDPELIDQIIRYHLEGNYDFTSNALKPTFPDGLDVETIRWQSLEEAWREARLPSEREHVTPFLYKWPQRFRLGSFTNAIDLSHFRWTVDEPEDLELVKIIYEALYPTKPQFTTHDILSYLNDHHELTKINAQFARNEGYLRSLIQDRMPP